MTMQPDLFTYLEPVTFEPWFGFKGCSWIVFRGDLKVGILVLAVGGKYVFTFLANGLRNRVTTYLGTSDSDEAKLKTVGLLV